VEDEAAWGLADLKGRGLHGKSLKLTITDGKPALLTEGIGCVRADNTVCFSSIRDRHILVFTHNGGQAC
jgi:hypothetical protein